MFVFVFLFSAVFCSETRLLEIFAKIDANSDERVTIDELSQWIRKSQNKHIDDDLQRQMTSFDTETIEWNQYKHTIYGTNDDEQFARIINRDKRRFEAADSDGNGRLSRDEFRDFLHPEQSVRMHETIVDETIEDLDLNGDGIVAEDEYIRDMFPAETQQLPEWVRKERDTFRTARDANGDGEMSRAEVREWIFPRNFDAIATETQFLMSAADTDHDSVLSRDEFRDAYDLFVGSHVTDFGESLMTKDEL